MTAGGRLTDVTGQHAGIGAGGGIVANAEDTGVFLRALMQGRLLDADRVAAMKGPALWLGGEVTGCGDVAYGWSGGADGFKTNVWVNGTGTRLAVLLLNGRTSGNDGDQTAGATLRRLYCAA